MRANPKNRTASRQLFAGCLLLALASATAQAQQTTGVLGSPDATTTIDGRYLPAPPQKFEGQINLNAAQSKPAWPARVVPPKGAPNILLEARIHRPCTWDYCPEQTEKAANCHVRIQSPGQSWKLPRARVRP